MFLKSDIQADNELSLPEIIEWVEGNMKAMEVFSRFGKKCVFFERYFFSFEDSQTQCFEKFVCYFKSLCIMFFLFV